MAATLTCPICSARQSGTATDCPQCGSDLSILGQLENLSHRYYNEALSLAKDPATHHEAIEKLHAALTLDPAHGESRIVLGKLYAQRGRYDEAIAQWQRVMELAPEGSDARDKAARAIDKASQMKDRMRRQEDTERSKAVEMDTARRRRGRLTLACAGIASFALGILGAFLVMRGQPAEGPAAGPAVDVRAAEQQKSSMIQSMMAAIPAAFRERVGRSKGRDLLDAMEQARFTVAPADGGGIRLMGTAPLIEVRQVLEKIAAAASGGRVDAAGVEIRDEYIEYVIKAGDCPELIAWRLCGMRNRWKEISDFSQENRWTLERMQIGSVLKIPKRLLANPKRG